MAKYQDYYTFILAKIITLCDTCDIRTKYMNICIKRN